MLLLLHHLLVVIRCAPRVSTVLVAALLVLIVVAADITFTVVETGQVESRSLLLLVFAVVLVLTAVGLPLSLLLSRLGRLLRVLGVLRLSIDLDLDLIQRHTSYFLLILYFRRILSLALLGGLFLLALLLKRDVAPRSRVQDLLKLRLAHFFCVFGNRLVIYAVLLRVFKVRAPKIIELFSAENR